MFDAVCVHRSYDLKDIVVARSGRIGTAVLRRLKTFDVNLPYKDRHRMPDL